MSTPTPPRDADFASVEPLRALLTEHFGPERARRWVDEWLATELERVTDPEFAALFEPLQEHYPVPIDAFSHRLLTTDWGRLLGGIRFFNRDWQRPFVELIAWDGTTDLHQLATVTREAWHAFRPPRARLPFAAGPLPAGVWPDNALYGARVSAIAEATTSQRAVTLEPLTADEASIAEAEAFVAQTYAALAASDPVLATLITPASASQLRHCVAEGSADWICVAGARIGVLAIAEETVDFVTGDVVVEKVIAPQSRGHGYSATAQGLWAARRLRRLSAGEDEPWLLGTIDQLNRGSIKTARAVGRQALLQWGFLSLDAETP
ncbi:MAG: hypothetical protein AAF648_16725 [Pseudomonadota bacterium]